MDSPRRRLPPVYQGVLQKMQAGYVLHSANVDGLFRFPPYLALPGETNEQIAVAPAVLSGLYAERYIEVDETYETDVTWKLTSSGQAAQ